MSNEPTRSQRQNAKNALVKKFWGNAIMTGGREKVATFSEYQVARREAWVHGMNEGLKAGLALRRKQRRKP